MLVESTKKVREPIAFGLLVVAALYVISALSVLFKSRDDIFLDFAGRAALVGHVFADPVLVIALVGAATLVAAFGQPSRYAKSVVVTDIVIGAISLVFLVVAWLAGLSADRITSFGGVAGAGKVVGIFLGLAQIGFLGLALFYVVAVYQSLPKPVKVPAWGQQGMYGWGSPPPGWGQQGWDQGQQGWAQGQQGWAQAQQGWAAQGQQGWAQPPTGWDAAQAGHAGAPGQPGQPEWGQASAQAPGQAGQAGQAGQQAGYPAPGPWGPPDSTPPGWGSTPPETGWAAAPGEATAVADAQIDAPVGGPGDLPGDSVMPPESGARSEPDPGATTRPGEFQAAAHRDDSVDLGDGLEEQTTTITGAGAEAFDDDGSAGESDVPDAAADTDANTVADDDTGTDDSGWWRPSSS